MIPSVAQVLKAVVTQAPIRAALSGEVKESRQAALLEGRIEGHHFVTNAIVIDEIGKDEDGKPIEILFGALAMQQWGISVNPPEEKLDLSHYPEEFLEF